MIQQSQSEPRRSFALPIRIDLLAVTLFGMVAFALYSLYLGKDANYDLRNYHYYGCYCLLHGRAGFDLYAAQFGSFLNPVPYLPFCWAIDHLRPIVAGGLFGALAGLGLGFLYALTWRSLSGVQGRTRIWLSLLAAIAGVWSPMYLAMVGTSFSDTWTPLLVIVGLYAVVRDRETPSTWLVFAAGLALGLTAGFKLVNSVYAIALLLTLSLGFRRPGFVPRILTYCAGAAVSALAMGGAWALTMVRQFRNPFFPFFNAIFRSPYFAPENFSDPRWKATSLAQVLSNPLHWAAEPSAISSEAPFRDLRFAIIVLLVLPALAVLFRRPKDVAAEPQHSLFDVRHRALVLSFFLFSYLLWLFTFGHQRYATPLELLSGVTILALCDCLFQERRSARRAFLVLALLTIVWVRPADWGRRPWGRTWFETEIPAALQARSALYVMPDSALSGYLVPMLPRDSRFVRIEANGRPLPTDRWLGPRVQQIIDQHVGPLRVLEGERFNYEGLARFGVSVKRDDCLKIHTYADEFTVCSAYRTVQGADSAVQLTHRQELARLTLPDHLRASGIRGGEVEQGWEFRGPAPTGPKDSRPRGRFDDQLGVTLKPPQGATQISGEVRFVSDRDNASTIVDLIWYRGDTELRRASPSTDVNVAGRECSIPILMDRPPEADSLLLMVRPWRESDGIVTVTGGDVVWWQRR
ncbi:MAG: glycosyltransferase family 87 protein [Bryobacteraceae bacterium]|nr:glycosyltransferase family 87 protein [Bryobacteraceae bacterium]